MHGTSLPVRSKLGSAARQFKHLSPRARRLLGLLFLAGLFFFALLSFSIHVRDPDTVQPASSSSKRSLHESVAKSSHTVSTAQQLGGTTSHSTTGEPLKLMLASHNRLFWYFPHNDSIKVLHEGQVRPKYTWRLAYPFPRIQRGGCTPLVARHRFWQRHFNTPLPDGSYRIGYTCSLSRYCSSLPGGPHGLSARLHECTHGTTLKQRQPNSANPTPRVPPVQQQCATRARPPAGCALRRVPWGTSPRRAAADGVERGAAAQLAASDQRGAPGPNRCGAGWVRGGAGKGRTHRRGGAEGGDWVQGARGKRVPGVLPDRRLGTGHAMVAVGCVGRRRVCAGAGVAMRIDWTAAGALCSDGDCDAGGTGAASACAAGTMALPPLSLVLRVSDDQ